MATRQLSCWITSCSKAEQERRSDESSFTSVTCIRFCACPWTVLRAGREGERALLRQKTGIRNALDKEALDLEKKPDGRWRSYNYDDFVSRDKANFDIFWLKDSLQASDNLPDPDVIAQEIVEDLEAALEQFRERDCRGFDLMWWRCGEDIGSFYCEG